MQLDPKGKMSARRAYQAEVSNRDMWHADGGPDDTPMDCAIRAYLEAAPSPSPAPGVVALKWREAEHIDGHVAWCASSIIGEFVVGFDDGWYATLDDWKWEWCPDNDPRTYEGPSAGQKACQAYFEGRVLSALASLSQPAKDEREGGEADYRDWLAGHEDPATGFIKAPISPANPAQVTELIEEAKDFTERMTGQPWACELVERLIDALTAAIGAGGQAVADAPHWKSLALGLGAHLENLERHCCVQTGKTGKTGNAHAQEGIELREAGRKLIALVQDALAHPAPSGQAVAVKKDSHNDSNGVE